MLTVTTSWDDGDILDLKLASLLEKYNIQGTFYIAKDYRKERLSDKEIKTLSQRHEIGAHTLTHPDLRTLSREEKVREIKGSKEWLEEVLGKKVTSFCYPSGFFDVEAIEVVREAGFRAARTTQLGMLELPADFFLSPTTLQVYPMPFRKLGARGYWWGKLLQPFSERAPALRALGVPLHSFYSFEALACKTFDIARARGGVFHLFGHSWEIEKYDLWQPLERVLSYIRNKQGCQYLTNEKVTHSL
jgi:peptidoglycan/xylan/chitin deacetylase (PgdA/CDA1 family)